MPAVHAGCALDGILRIARAQSLASPHEREAAQVGGRITVVDGPFTESKEIVGGYAVIEAASKEDALGLARRFMELHREHWPSFEGESEVRPFELEP